MHCSLNRAGKNQFSFILSCIDHMVCHRLLGIIQNKSGWIQTFPSFGYCMANIFNPDFDSFIWKEVSPTLYFFYWTIRALHCPPLVLVVFNRTTNSNTFYLSLAFRNAFCVGFNTGVLSSRIGWSRVALVFTDLVEFLGISNPGIKTSLFTSRWASNLCINSAFLSL